MVDEISEGIQILSMAEEHIESFHTCLDSVVRERSYLALLEAPSPAATREFVLDNLSNDCPQFVAMKGDEVVGWCNIIPRRMEGFTHCSELGMGVLQEYRGRGVGEQLARKTIRKAKEKGLEKIELSVFASNTPAIKLYDKLGFVVEGVKRKARKLDGTYDDIVEMGLFLVRPDE